MKEIKTPLTVALIVIISLFAIILIIGLAVGLIWLGWKGQWLGVTGIVAAYYAGVINKTVSND